jgi:dTDP-4-amino-4,6-dideoxygalactose transaminase
MPFSLFRSSFTDILIKNKIGRNLKLVNDINILQEMNKKEERQIIIIHIYCLNHIIKNGHDNIFYILKKTNSYVLLVNTEFINWGGYKLSFVLDQINNIDKKDSLFYFFEYNNINYNYIKENYSNVRAVFLPLTYYDCLEKFYIENIENDLNINIGWKDKDIDILFYGALNDRRSNILENLKNSYPDKIIAIFNGDNKSLCNFIRRSKIIINIIHYKDNIIFDYYRNSFLLANKCLLISEKPKNIDFSLETGMVNIDENLILTDYDNFTEIVGEYLNKTENEIKVIIEKQYNWFKRFNNMESALLNKIKEGEIVFNSGKNLSLFKVFMSEDVLKPLNDVLMSGFITQGPQVEKFEEKLACYFGNQNILTLNSATSGLTLALRLLLEADAEDNWPGFDIENDYVASPVLTCFATNAAILANGCKIKWIDTDNNTANISIEDVRSKLNANTKILYLVHWGGYPVDLDALKTLQEEHFSKYGYKFRIIEDCAHAFGASYKNKKLGNHDNICVFSLQAIKHLTTGDGGIILLPNTKLYERAKLIRWFGIDRDKRNYNRKDFRMENDIAEWGYKYHMNDINATIGIYNLPYIDGLLEKNRKNYQYLYNGLQNIQNINLFENKDDRETAAWLFTMKVKRKTDFIDKMKEYGISTSQVHNRNDINTCVQKYSCELPGINDLEKELICIPVGWWLEKDDLDYMIEKIKNGW